MGESRKSTKCKYTMIYICVLIFVTFLCCKCHGVVYADGESAKREVKVAFFPMDGYHIINPDGSYDGVEVEYLHALSSYVNWDIKYVVCDSWEDALSKLKKREVDLVGTSQYNEERAKDFLYAEFSNIYTFGAIATNPDKNIAFEDFTKMQDLHYGIVKGYVKINEMYEYFAKHGIANPRVTEFTSTRELQNALMNHEIDAMVHTFMEVQDGQHLIGRFASSPTFFMTYHGNEDLMDELNDGIANLKYQQPSFEWDLIQRFYENKWDDAILFTTEELQYMEESEGVVVGYKDGFYPFNYEENGKLKGFIRDKLDVSGLPIRYKKVKSTSEGLRAVLDGELDVMVHMAGKYPGEKNDSLQILNDYASVPFVLVTKSNHQVENIKSIVTMTNFKDDLQELIVTDNKDIEYKSSMTECFEAVANGEADALMGGAYMAEYKIRTVPEYGDLCIATVLNGEIHVHSIVNRDADELLKSIINKALGRISEKEVTEYKLKDGQKVDISLKKFVQTNHEVIMLLLLVWLVLIILVAIHIVRDSRRIQTLLYKDTNMDIWNQHYFIKELEEKRKRLGNQKYAIVYTNITRMRQFHLVYGRNAAVEIYRCLKQMLQAAVDEKSEICARVSDDHFLLLIKYDCFENLMERLEQIAKEVETSICEMTDNQLQIQMGVVPDISGKKDPSMLIEYAIQVLDGDKANANRKIHVYNEEFEEQMKECHKKEQLLDTISIADYFEVYYQNKVDIRTEEIVGAEALIRFRDPSDENRIKSPWYFIPYMEQIGRIEEIDLFVLEKVCQLQRRRMDAGLKVVPISCNFSRMHFIQPGFSERFEKVLERYQLAKDLVEVEITETMVVEEEDMDILKENLKEMKKKGILLAIDDFGSGYSSLGVFEHVPAAIIKMDRSFMVNHDYGERQLKIMKGIVRLSEDLNTDIVCEGVETEEDVQLMRNIATYVAQGYFYSKPRPENEFEELLNREEKKEAK